MAGRLGEAVHAARQVHGEIPPPATNSGAACPQSCPERPCTPPVRHTEASRPKSEASSMERPWFYVGGTSRKGCLDPTSRCKWDERKHYVRYLYAQREGTKSDFPTDRAQITENWWSRPRSARRQKRGSFRAVASGRGRPARRGPRASGWPARVSQAEGGVGPRGNGPRKTGAGPSQGRNQPMCIFHFCFIFFYNFCFISKLKIQT
jgi:hypothetical protein